MKLNLKSENARSHGSIDFYFKIYFAEPFGFKKKVYGSVQYIGVT